MALPFQPGDDQGFDDTLIFADGTGPGSGGSALDELLALLPEGEFDTLRFTIQRIAETFPGELNEITTARLQGWIDELTSGTRPDGRPARTEQQLRSDIFRVIVGPDLIQETLGVDETVALQLIQGDVSFSDLLSGAAGIVTDPSGPPGAEGSTDEYPGVMPGGELIQVARPGQDDLFIQAYEYPPGSGQYIAWQYEGVEQLEAVFGPDWALQQPRRMVDQDFLRDSVTISDAVGEILGIDISFRTHMQNIVDGVISESAITDPTMVGLMANDPGIQDLIAQSVAAGWTAEQLQAEIRLSDFWTETLYPGIETFYAAGSLNPEEDWARYMAKMEPALRALGVDDGGDGYRSEIGDYIDAGVDPDLALEMVPVFQRAATSPQYASTLDAWMQRNLGVSLDFDTWFDVLAGQATPDIQAVVEAAQLQFAADQQSLALEADQITRIAELSDLSEREAAQAFEQVSAQLLALGDTGLARYGLSEDDILSSQTGIEATSGRSISEIKQIARKTALELGLADDRKINLYVGYDPTRGTPVRPGLAGLNPIGA